MKEIKMNYFVSKNLEELSGLEGKVVGVRITSMNFIEPMVYYGIKDDRHEFLTQGKMRVQATIYDEYDLLNEVAAWTLDSDWISLKRYAVVFNFERRIKIYSPGKDRIEFEKRRELLIQNNLWGEPR